MTIGLLIDLIFGEERGKIQEKLLKELATALKYVGLHSRQFSMWLEDDWSAANGSRRPLPHPTPARRIHDMNITVSSTSRAQRVITPQRSCDWVALPVRHLLFVRSANPIETHRYSGRSKAALKRANVQHLSVFKELVTTCLGSDEHIRRTMLHPSSSPNRSIFEGHPAVSRCLSLSVGSEACPLVP